MTEKPEIVIQHKPDGTVVGWLPKVYGATTTYHKDQRPASEPKVEVKDSVSSSEEYANWGSNNMWPTDALKKAQPSGVFGRNVVTNAEMAYGQGIKPYIKRIEGGKAIYDEFQLPAEIEDFIGETDLNNYFLEQLNDFYMFYISFCRYDFSAKSSQSTKQKILRLSHLDSEFCRIAKLNNGVSSSLFYSPQFAVNGKYDKKNGVTYPLKQSNNIEDILQQLGNNRSIVQALRYPTAGGFYYPNQPWMGLFLKDSWLDVVNINPSLIMALHRNSIHIKYHIEVSVEYWRFIHKDWDNNETFTDAKRQEIIDDYMKRVNDFLCGPKAAGNSWVTFIGFDPITQKEVPGITITPLKDYTIKDQYLPNAMAGNLEICYAQGIDPSMIGLQTPGSQNLSGSGSDKLVAWNNKSAMLKPVEDLLLKPLYFAQKFNGWDKNIVWKIDRTLMVTKNENKSGTVSTTQNNQA